MENITGLSQQEMYKTFIKPFTDVFVAAGTGIADILNSSKFALQAVLSFSKTSFDRSKNEWRSRNSEITRQYDKVRQANELAMRGNGDIVAFAINPGKYLGLRMIGISITSQDTLNLIQTVDGLNDFLERLNERSVERVLNVFTGRSEFARNIKQLAGIQREISRVRSGGRATGYAAGSGRNTRFQSAVIPDDLKMLRDLIFGTLATESLVREADADNKKPATQEQEPEQTEEQVDEELQQLAMQFIYEFQQIGEITQQDAEKMVTNAKDLLTDELNKMAAIIELTTNIQNASNWDELKGVVGAQKYGTVINTVETVSAVESMQAKALELLNKAAEARANKKVVQTEAVEQKPSTTEQESTPEQAEQKPEQKVAPQKNIPDAPDVADREAQDLSEQEQRAVYEAFRLNMYEQAKTIAAQMAKDAKEIVQENIPTNKVSQEILQETPLGKEWMEVWQNLLNQTVAYENLTGGKGEQRG